MTRILPAKWANKYSKLLSTLINFICVKDRHKRPNIDDILNHPYVYSYYIVYGGQLAKANAIVAAPAPVERFAVLLYIVLRHIQHPSRQFARLDA